MPKCTWLTRVGTVGRNNKTTCHSMGKCSQRCKHMLTHVDCHRPTRWMHVPITATQPPFASYGRRQSAQKMVEVLRGAHACTVGTGKQQHGPSFSTWEPFGIILDGIRQDCSCSQVSGLNECAPVATTDQANLNSVDRVQLVLSDVHLHGHILPCFDQWGTPPNHLYFSLVRCSYVASYGFHISYG